MNIKDTVETTLKEQGVPLSPVYQDYADRVVSALEVRESDIFARLLDEARQEGLSPVRVENLLNEAGLTRIIEQVQADPRIEALERTIAEAQELLASLRSGN